jgi:hypothetical protein
VISVLALFIALGGVGYAATTIGSKQIANNSVASQDLRTTRSPLRTSATAPS